jgi:threonine synthase
MRYISTRDPFGTSCGFNDVLLAGLAPDGGLYVPESYPQLDWDDVLKFKEMSYIEIALAVMRMYISDGEISTTDLWKILKRSYHPRLFGSEDITPIQPLSQGLGLLKLSNGPTLAFKDVALQFLANVMDHVLEQRDQYINIVGATSGDTGSAAEEAVRGRKRLRIFMLSPHGRMSPFQQMQMYRIHDPKVFNLVSAGTFDDCQTAVKLINSDADYKARYSIGAVNSINWARILAQVVYYIYGYSRVMTDKSERLTIAVPSGNFGNALAAYVAGKMGLRVRILVATNKNDVLHEFFGTGVYRVRKGEVVRVTHSPSMDIASASNFERFMFDEMGRDPVRLTSVWKILAERGEIMPTRTSLPDNIIIESGSVTDAETIDTIKLVFNQTGIIIDPHTAVAAKVFYDLQSGPGFGPALIAETAQPAKFEDAIQRALGFKMGVPASCQHLLHKDEHLTRIHSEDPSEIASQVKRFIKKHVD